MRHAFRIDDFNLSGCAAWGPLVAPKSLSIDLTNGCNLACKFCNVNANSAHWINMDRSLFEAVVIEAGRLRIFEVRLTGGEPLLRSDLSLLASFAAKQGLAVWILSNGFALDRRRAFELASSGTIGVRISIDSQRPQVHDALRGVAGSWRKAVDAIGYCLDAGLETVLGMTVGMENARDISETAALSNALGARFATCIVMPFGRGKAYLAEAQRVGCGGADIVKKAALANQGSRCCSAAAESLSIDVRGNVSACPFTRPVDNLGTTTLEAVLSNPAMMKYTQPIPASPECLSCKFRTTLVACVMKRLCRGGCWALFEMTDESHETHLPGDSES
jgi:MoaA/NifB/PqqE/SkfB family radical SAM enzyme